MTSYTLNDPTKLWGITASTIAPKSNGTLAVNATTVNANTLQPYGANAQLDIMADTITPSDFVRGLTITSTTVNSTTVNATTIQPLASTLSINASAIGSPATSSLTITPSAGGEIIFNTNYIKINNTKVYFQSTDPGAVGAGSIWFDLP